MCYLPLVRKTGSGGRGGVSVHSLRPAGAGRRRWKRRRRRRRRRWRRGGAMAVAVVEVCHTLGDSSSVQTVVPVPV